MGSAGSAGVTVFARAVFARVLVRATVGGSRVTEGVFVLARWTIGGGDSTMQLRWCRTW
jgi:hypothetical protein